MFLRKGQPKIGHQVALADNSRQTGCCLRSVVCGILSQARLSQVAKKRAMTKLVFTFYLLLP
jgi:hypothetical protein